MMINSVFSLFLECQLNVFFNSLINSVILLPISSALKTSTLEGTLGKYQILKP